MSVLALVRDIPLNQLVLSPTNVRTVRASAAEDAKLKASLRARGVLQNLVVHPTTPDGAPFAVDAGGRRLEQLQELAAEGAIPEDHPVPCKVEAAEAAAEASLMENAIRAAMHPADEFAAMAALIEDGASIEAVATRFGASERHVRQRLRLGKLAPELLDHYRAGTITLEVVMAFTLGADHAAQLAVWGKLKEQGHFSAYTVRRLLTESAVAADSDLGLFVGLAAYEAAGGAVTRDLFSRDEDGCFMDDATLVQRLALEKLEAKAAELRADWAWAKAELDTDYGFQAEYDRVEAQDEFPPEVSAELERIEQRLREIEELPEEASTDELAIESAQLSERYDELVETTESEERYTEADRKTAGCIVTVGEDGEFEIYAGLVDRNLHPASDDGADDDEDGEATTIGYERPAPAPSREQLLRKECGISQGLVDDLKAHRQQIMRAYLAGNFAIAFDVALYTLCVDLLARRHRFYPLSLRATCNQPRSSLNDLRGTAADHLLQAHEKTLDTGWLSLPQAERFPALAALPAEAKQRLFAWCIAATLEPQLAIEDKADPVIEAAGERLDIPFADCWRPTAANYWGRVKKAHGLEVAGAVLGSRWARDHADDKKATLAAALEKAFDPAKSSDCIGLDQAARDAAAAWMPPGMICAVPEQSSINAEDGEEADDEIDGLDDDLDLEPQEASDSGDDGEELPAFLTEEELAAE
jgi:ParB family chromosome partitioning protein